MAVPFCIPTCNKWEFLLLHSLISICIVSILDFGQSDSCVKVSYLFAFLWWHDAEHFFICCFAICIPFLGEVSLKVLAHFLIGFLAFLPLSFRTLYILITVFYQIYLLQLFPPSLSYLPFSLLWLLKSSFLILIKSSLSILAFMCCTSGIVSKQSLIYPKSSKFSLVIL